MPQDGIHTLNEGAWHYCGRCERKMKLSSEAKWQYGILVCSDCFDKFPILPGSIELRQANVLQTIVQQPDLRPNEKLTNPTIVEDEQDILLG